MATSAGGFTFPAALRLRLVMLKRFFTALVRVLSSTLFFLLWHSFLSPCMMRFRRFQNLVF